MKAFRRNKHAIVPCAPCGKLLASRWFARQARGVLRNAVIAVKVVHPLPVESFWHQDGSICPFCFAHAVLCEKRAALASKSEHAQLY